MKIFNDIDDIVNIENTAIALGNFDGVHLGHQILIKQTVAKAKENRLKSGVFTFSNHPKNLIKTGEGVKNIIYEDEKIRLIEALGVDYLFNIPFTETIMKMSPEEYIRKLIVEKFRAKEVFCGFNYHFGYKAVGNGEFLQEMGKELGFNVTMIPPVTVDNDVVSSTLIRNIIKSGDMAECTKYLGRPYDIIGEVVVGNQLGKTIGFPTSNITIDENMVTPPNGVYITYCIYNGVKYPSITNVGVKPTIGSFKKNMETHIFNFNKELYGKMIKVEFLKRTRPEVKFSSKEELAAQITKDCLIAKEYHMKKTNVFDGVEDTLYIPLAARIYASEKFPEFFHDEKALSLKQYIPADSIEKNTEEYFYMASVCRQQTMDKKIREFLEKNSQSNVVFLGAGLETAYNRIKNTGANFFQVDLPDVIEKRKQVLGIADNEKLIAGDMFDLDWIKDIDTSLPTLISVSGVYQYFSEGKIADMIRNMKLQFPEGELIFDATNSKGLKLANKYVRKTGNLNAQMYFSVDEPEDLAKATDTRLMDVSGFFQDALKHCRGLKFKTRMYMYFADKLHRTKVIHLKFN